MSVFFVIFIVVLFMNSMKFIIVGKAASGKDWLQKMMVERGYVPMRQYTTRDKRDNESGDEYHFVNETEFKEMEKSGKFVSVNFYRIGWYGISMDEFMSCNVAILSPANVKDIFSKYPELRSICRIIYLDIPVDVRRERLSMRYEGKPGDDNEIRIMNDEKDFAGFKDYDAKLCDEGEISTFINNLTPLSKMVGE